MPFIHRYAIVEQLASQDGVTLFSATLPGSSDSWTLLQGTPPPATASDARTEFIRLTLGWVDEGIDSFARSGYLYLASTNRALVEAKGAFLRQKGIFGPGIQPTIPEPPFPVAIPAPPLPMPAPQPQPPLPVSLQQIPLPPVPGTLPNPWANPAPPQPPPAPPFFVPQPPSQPTPPPDNRATIEFPSDTAIWAAPPGGPAVVPKKPQPPKQSWWKWFLLTVTLAGAGGGLFVFRDDLARSLGQRKPVDTPAQTQQPRAADNPTPSNPQPANPQPANPQPTSPAPADPEPQHVVTPEHTAEPVQKPSPIPVEPQPVKDEPKPEQPIITPPNPQPATPAPITPAPVIPAIPPAEIVYFSADPKTPITPGTRVVLSWGVKNAVGINLDPKGPVKPEGKWILRPMVTTRYELQATNSAGEVVRSAIQVVVAAEQFKIVQFSAEPKSGFLNGAFELNWKTVGARGVRIQLEQRPPNSQFDYSYTSPNPSDHVTVYASQAKFTSYGAYVFRLTATFPDGSTQRAETTFNLIQNRF